MMQSFLIFKSVRSEETVEVKIQIKGLHLTYMHAALQFFIFDVCLRARASQGKRKEMWVVLHFLGVLTHRGNEMS